MSWLYIIFTWLAALFVADDMGLGNIHPIKGFFVLIALVWNTAYTIYRKDHLNAKRN